MTEAKSLRYITLDVFTTRRYAGNPLALVLIAPGQDVDSKTMQLIAREFNYSETVFLYEPESTDTTEWSMRIFTVDAELPFAGHPVLGTAKYVLSVLSKEIQSSEIKAKLRCNAGPINIGRDETDIWADIPHDFHLHGTAVSKTQVIDVQPGLQPEMIKGIDIVSPVNGMTFLVTELADLESLASVAITGRRPDLKLDSGWDKGFVGTAYYVKTAENTYRTRMLEKTFEDPATGSMSCGLAVLLAMKSESQTVHLSFTQGVEMGRQSEIGVSIVLNDDLRAVRHLTLRGNAVKVLEGVISL